MAKDFLWAVVQRSPGNEGILEDTNCQSCIFTSLRAAKAYVKLRIASFKIPEVAKRIKAETRIERVYFRY